MPDDPLSLATAPAETIDTYLVGLADGLAEAQRKLNRLADGQDGPSPVAYQIPRLDFELHMTATLETGPSGPRIKGRRRVRFQTAGGKGSGTVTSTVKGSIVAVPAAGGRPLPRLDALAAPLRKHEVGITAVLFNDAGELLSGEAVEFNIDRDQSAALNGAARLRAPAPAPGTALRAALVQTDPRGEARTVLTLDPSEPPGKAIVVTIDALARSRVLIWRIPEE